jgi:hypothetical protein
MPRKPARRYYRRQSTGFEDCPYQRFGRHCCVRGYSRSADMSNSSSEFFSTEQARCRSAQCTKHRKHAGDPIESMTAAIFSDDRFFSSPALAFFNRGGWAPALPQGRTDSERFGRLFFEDVPADIPNNNFKPGVCAACHTRSSSHSSPIPTAQVRRRRSSSLRHRIRPTSWHS